MRLLTSIYKKKVEDHMLSYLNRIHLEISTEVSIKTLTAIAVSFYSYSG